MTARPSGLFERGRKIKLRVSDGFPERLLRAASLEGAIAFGTCLALAGIAGATYAIFQWGHSSFGSLVPSEVMRITIPSVTALAMGTQIIFGGFLLGFIEVE